jgi:hypothetical protein
LAFLLAVFQRTGRISEDTQTVRARRLNQSDKKGEDRTCLLCLPPKLVQQWLKEIHIWGCFSVAALTERRELDEFLQMVCSGRVEIAVVALTQIPTLQASKAASCGNSFKDICWEVVAWDEVHTLSPAALVAAMGLQARCRILLTGTVMSNIIWDAARLVRLASGGTIFEPAEAGSSGQKV